MQTENCEQIAKLNDEFRMRSRKMMLFTAGIRALCESYDGRDLVMKIRSFDTFTEDNDPYGEHDFGSLAWHGRKVFWKIDYYDQKLEYGEDPLSLKCRRVLTVMLASEY